MPLRDSSPGASGPGTTTVAGGAVLRQLGRQVLARRAGAAGSVESIVAATNSAYDDLVRASTPLLGAVGVEALSGRAIHLARRDFPWLVPNAADRPGGPFAHVIPILQKQEPAVAMDAAAAVFAALAGLLVTIIGESLTSGLLGKAWPDAFPTGTQRSHKA